MNLCKFHDPQRGARVGLVEGNAVFDLTALDAEHFSSLTVFFELGDRLEVLARLVRRGIAIAPYPFEKLDRPPGDDIMHLLPPIDQQEVWAAGVTYTRSREARKTESQLGGDCYERAYSAARPELFFKATPHRTVGPNDTVCIRRDSAWSVPEPELALVLNSRLELVGLTAGNDMSARDIEGENPLYLPQAKVYTRCCALGPAVRLVEPETEIGNLAISLKIFRHGATVFSGDASTSQMKRSFGELINYLGRENSFPHGVILLTGTGIVPPDDFSLQPGDEIEIAVEHIGVLRNQVIYREG